MKRPALRLLSVLFLLLPGLGSADDAAVDALIVQLGGDAFAERETAQKALVDLPDEVDLLLRSRLAAAADPEVMGRLEAVLAQHLRRRIARELGCTPEEAEVIPGRAPEGLEVMLCTRRSFSLLEDPKVLIQVRNVSREAISFPGANGKSEYHFVAGDYGCSGGTSGFPDIPEFRLAPGESRLFPSACFAHALACMVRTAGPEVKLLEVPWKLYCDLAFGQIAFPGNTVVILPLPAERRADLVVRILADQGPPASPQDMTRQQSARTRLYAGASLLSVAQTVSVARHNSDAWSQLRRFEGTPEVSDFVIEGLTRGDPNVLQYLVEGLAQAKPGAEPLKPYFERSEFRPALLKAAEDLSTRLPAPGQGQRATGAVSCALSFAKVVRASGSAGEEDLQVHFLRWAELLKDPEMKGYPACFLMDLIDQVGSARMLPVLAGRLDDVTPMLLPQGQGARACDRAAVALCRIAGLDLSAFLEPAKPGQPDRFRDVAQRDAGLVQVKAWWEAHRKEYEKP